MPTYKESLTAAMTALAADQHRVFIGYGLTHGRAAGTLAGAAPHQIIETPVAENLMVGLATGMALRGQKPVVYIERCDFLLNALDALVNHLAKIHVMSRGEFSPAAIIRVVVGNRTKPLFTGATHTQDFALALTTMLVNHPTSVVTLGADADVADAYSHAAARADVGITSVIFEYKDLL